MKWFVYFNGSGKNHLFVQAKTADSSQKRLTRWSKLRKVNVSEAQSLHVGYETMSEASITYQKFTMVDGSY